MESDLTNSIHEIVEDEFSCFICLELSINKELGRTFCCKQYICKTCFSQQLSRNNTCAHCRNSGNYKFEPINDLSGSLHRIEQRINNEVHSNSILNSILESHETEISTAANEINKMHQLNENLNGLLVEFQDNLEKQDIESKQKDVQLSHAKEYVHSLLNEREFLRSKIEYLEKEQASNQVSSSPVRNRKPENCTFNDAYFIDKHEIPDHSLALKEVGNYQGLEIFKQNVSMVLKVLGDEIKKI